MGLLDEAREVEARKLARDQRLREESQRRAAQEFMAYLEGHWGVTVTQADPLVIAEYKVTWPEYGTRSTHIPDEVEHPTFFLDDEVRITWEYDNGGRRRPLWIRQCGGCERMTASRMDYWKSGRDGLLDALASVAKEGPAVCPYCQAAAKAARCPTCQREY